MEQWAAPHLTLMHSFLYNKSLLHDIYKVYNMIKQWAHKRLNLSNFPGVGTTPKNPIPFPNRKMGLLTLGFFGVKLKNAMIILILYLKSKDSVTLIIMLL